MLYIFRNTSVDSEKQLISWLSQAGLSTISQAAKDPLANTKPEVMVKQETFDVADPRAEGDNPDMGVDAHNYLIQQQQLPYQQGFEFGEPSGSTSELTDEPAPKRARRAALKKAPIDETDDADDDLDAAMQITKAEDDDSEDIDQPDYVDAPSTSADDQPGPSGVGKAAVEAPHNYVLVQEGGKFLYKCLVCLETFTTMNDYKIHKQKHISLLVPKIEKTDSQEPQRKYRLVPKDDKYVYQCIICQETFTTMKDYKLHAPSHLIVPKVEEIEPEFTQRTYRLAFKDGKYVYECLICHETFLAMKDYKEHAPIHLIIPKIEQTFTEWPPLNFGAANKLVRRLNAEKGIHTCDLCPEIYKSEILLKRHRSTHFDPTIKCEDCEELFHDEFFLNNHLMEVHGKDLVWKCDLCSKAFRQEAFMKKHRIRHFDPTIACPQCDKHFYDKYTLKQHVDFVHNQQRNFACDFCSYATGNKNTLQIHVVRKHTQNFAYSCDICGKGYTKKYLVENHRKSVHEGFQHICDECGKGFSYLGGLQAHKRLHDENAKKREALPCEFCGEKFKFLKEHVKKVHLGETNYICDICGKGFHAKTALRVHIMRKHTNERPVQCNLCGHCMATNNELKAHMKRRHSGDEPKEDDRERPFKCNICHKRFKMSSSLADHLRKHRGVKAYACEICQESFYSKHYLKQHKCAGIADQLQQTLTQ